MYTIILETIIYGLASVGLLCIGSVCYWLLTDRD